MGRQLAVFYTPDDDTEHALLAVDPNGINSGYFINDITFSPADQGHLAPGSYTPHNSERIIGGTYCPVDGYRYIFFATADNKIYWTRIYGHYQKYPPDPLLQGIGFLPVNELTGYAPSSVADIAAYFNGSQIEVVVLMNTGHLWRMSGEPWTNKNIWSLVPFFDSFTGAKRIAVFEGAGWGHIMIASLHDVTEVFYTWNRWGKTKIWTFAESIIDVGAFFTGDDGVAHIIVATTGNNRVGSAVHEITFTPAMVPPAKSILGAVNFAISSIGAYVKPDAGRHVIMLESFPSGQPNNLYLSWYYPGWAGFQYGLWPQLTAW